MKDSPMKEYKVKEALLNLKQSFDDLKLKFEIMVDVLDEIKYGQENDCKHERSTWFDRTLTGKDSKMHTVCSDCGETLS